MARGHRRSTRRPQRSRTSKQPPARRSEADLFEVPPPSEPAHAELVAGIESFSPSRLRREREEVFRDLRDDLRRAAQGDDARAEDDYEGILWQIVGILARTSASTRAASAIGGRRMAREPASAFLRPKTYWRERRKLERDHEKYVRRLRDHPLVRSFRFDEIIFFAPDEVICPHGRSRRRCQGIRAGLELLRVRPFSDEGASRTRLLQDFRRYRVRPDADPEAYCLPITRERWEE